MIPLDNKCNKFLSLLTEPEVWEHPSFGISVDPVVSQLYISIYQYKLYKLDLYCSPMSTGGAFYVLTTFTVDIWLFTPALYHELDNLSQSIET